MLGAVSQAAPRGESSSSSTPAAVAPATGTMQLKVRRLSDSVELVIEGAGMAPQLRQSGGASGWQGELTVAAPSGLRVGPQRLSIPELGFQTITFDGSGSSYRIGIAPVAGAPLARPVVSADGQNLILSFPAAAQVALPVARFNTNKPGFIPQPTVTPPLQPRAVAPPVGDMAVGSMRMRSPGSLQLKGPNVTLTFRNAPARDALMSLARLGGYGFVYLSENLTDEGKEYGASQDYKSKYSDSTSSQGNKFERGVDGSLAVKENPRLVTVSFSNESYSNALNAILAAGGLQGRLQGRTIFAGPNMLALATYGPQLTKVYRLNQANAQSAAQYLASLGALISIPQTISSTQSSGTSTSTGAGVAAGGSTSSSTNTSSSQTTEIQTFGGKRGPLLGLTGTIDGRLSTITIVGDPFMVEIAETFLRQIDLRQRQVALSVKILDVTLANDAVTENSFAFRFGNNFIVNDNGQLLGAFGRSLPAGSASFNQFKTTTATTDTSTAADNASSARSLNNSNSSNSFSANSSSGTSSTSSTNSSSSNTLVVNDSLTNQQIQSINDVLTNATGQTIATDLVTGLPVVVNTNATGSTSVQTNANQIANIISQVTGRNVSLTTLGSINNFSNSNNQSDSSSGSTGNTSLSATNNSGSSAVSNTSTNYTSRTRPNPGLSYPDNSFYDFVRSVITSQSTKILASPTIVLSENSEEIMGGAEVSAEVGETAAATIGRPRANESYVTVGEQVITSYNVVAGGANANNTCQPVFGIAGLTFGARISKIDDNGFVTFSMSPAVTAATRTQLIPSCGPVDILAIRRLDTGSARVRDGQTLIMTGVISDSDIQSVSKWPVLGDLPLIGQFFRTSAGSRDKRELVIMVTPKIINDYEGGNYGYGYQPETLPGRRLVGVN